MKVLVAGARGKLGSAVAREFRSRGDVVALGRADLDITDEARVLKRIAAESPDLIINCAAYTAVDAAQSDPLSALHANAFGVRALARAAAAVDATLVHYGSDFVFDGRANRPYVESDRPNPQSVYAMSKLLGEWFAADAPRHYVLRVESLFSQTGDGPATGSVATIVARLRSGDEVPVFVDRTVTPTYVVDAAAATVAIVERKLPSGVYHCVNSGHCTWWEFAEEAARVIGTPARLTPITLDHASLPAPRPKYCALSNETLAGFGVVLPDWRDALRRSLSVGPLV
jgi:dTDP-4-dehydrorhamnose reductase